MRIGNRYDALIAKNTEIELTLVEEMKRPLPDPFVLLRLKRRKLLVRDEIQAWERLSRMRRTFASLVGSERSGQHGP